jgi:hypothetical protein
MVCAAWRPDRRSMTLTSGLLGQVITPDHDGYDTARQVWNGAVDRRPAFIVRCCHAQQVATAVLFAGHHGLPLACAAAGTASQVCQSATAVW